MIKTIILCGGRGSRLRPLTDTVPKPLVPLNGKPILQHNLEYYISRGYRRFVLCLGYRGDLIRDFVSRGSFDAEVEFADAGEQASILERLCHARPMMGKTAFVVYGDTLVSVDLDQMVAEHERHGAAVTITTGDIRSPFGLVTADEAGWARSFEEKPVLTYYIGQMLLEAAALDDVEPAWLRMPDGEGLVRLLGRLIEEGRVRVHPHRGVQITFNTQQEYRQAERELIAFFTHRETDA
ncbi:MAG: nucleotidyltransferase family protein [Deltaproteobacteria bacterium]|nr:nucleotidyltransferase family protein [Deltaproteobacteria bacterium]MBI3076375.1 nucleotidyltransferase family protein [Deltaproteobacteria bacterium]